MITFRTSPSLRALIHDGVDLFTAQLDQVSDDQWTSSTPCSEWSIADLAAHVVHTAEGARAIVSGTPREEGRVPLAARAAWTGSSTALLAATSAAALDDRWPLPPDSPDAKLVFYACDFAIHSWDVASARGHEDELPDEWLDFMRTFFAAAPREALRRPRAFADPVDPRPGDGPTRILMAFLGRRPT
jgi:uncharacterized protein (TIGR03086 family)